MSNNIVSNVVRNMSLSRALDVATETKSEAMRLKVRLHLKLAQNKLKELKKGYYRDLALVGQKKRPSVPVTEARKEHLKEVEFYLSRMDGLRL